MNMKRIIAFLMAAVVILAVGCKENDETAMSNINQKCVEKTVKALNDKYAGIDDIEDRVARGVAQAAALWTEVDGTPSEFETFCMDNFVAGCEARARMAAQLE